MKEENSVREFQKYKSRGAYHWEQISSHIIKRNTFVLARYKNVINILKLELPSLKKKRVLDIGCGDGVLSYLISKEGAVVSGIDYSGIAIEFAKEKTKGLDINYVQGSAYALPFDDDSFDIIVSSDVIEHLEDVPKYLSEINRVVRDGGSVVLSTPIRYTEHPLDKEHVVEWFKDEYKEVIAQQFDDNKFFYSHPLVIQEIYEAKFLGKTWGRVFVNLLSFIYNPFESFKSRYKHMSLQYSCTKVKK
ncbi:MAG TPA: class I SAM-dependent methyltransferase [Arcobacter sp.]|nr:class I SAM-dependent methyltransferase [Arcobacter sp.]